MGFLYVIPAVASGVLLVLSWADVLSHPRLVAACWLAGIILQFVVGEPVNFLWLAGLIINAVVGVCLAIRLKMA